MHEFGIVQKMFKEIRTSGKTKRAVVMLGALKGVDEKQFKTLFKTLTANTPLQKMELEVRVVPVKVRCPACKFEGAIPDVPHIHSVFLSWPCPECGASAEILSGNEERIETLE